jgi:uncharacterized membrane protein
VRCFDKTGSAWAETGVAALITLLATFAKPSFAICLLPAIGLLAGYRLLKKQPINRRLLLLGFIVPSVVLLAWQFVETYGSPQESGILFYPFGVMAAYSDWLFIKFLLSILFPLLAAVLYWREAARDLRITLAWLAFLLSAFYTYFLAEGPPRTLDGNFLWSSEIALLVLFCVSTLFLLERARLPRRKVVGSGLAWLSHVAFGVMYYWHVLVTQKYS